MDVVTETATLEMYVVTETATFENACGNRYIFENGCGNRATNYNYVCY
jgi:hypothetical protein